MALQTLCGLFVAHTSFGMANEFTLRAKTGSVRICCKSALPPMRPGDMIVVTLGGSEVCSITNLSTGTEVQYRPLAPAGPYWRKEVTLRHMFFLALLVLILNYAAFEAGCLSQMQFIRDGEGAMILISVISYLILLSWMFRAAIVDRHNAIVSNQIQERVRSACLNTSIWDIAPPDEGVIDEN